MASDLAVAQQLQLRGHYSTLLKVVFSLALIIALPMVVALHAGWLEDPIVLESVPTLGWVLTYFSCWVGLLVGAYGVFGMAFGYPRLTLTPGFALIQRLPFWDEIIDLNRYGTAFSGKTGGKHPQLMTYLYSREHEAALRQSGNFVSPDEHSAERSIGLSLFIKPGGPTVDEICAAMNNGRNVSSIEPVDAIEIEHHLTAHRRGSARNRLVLGGGIMAVTLIEMLTDAKAINPFVVAGAIAVASFPFMQLSAKNYRPAEFAGIVAFGERWLMPALLVGGVMIVLSFVAGVIG